MTPAQATKQLRRSGPRPTKALEEREELRRPPQPEPPSLRFSPYAWAKLLFLRDLGQTEVGGFGITPEDDLLLVQDFRLVRQCCTAVSVDFDPKSVADLFDEQIDRGRQFEQFARIWIHTHPGGCALPSPTDEDTFAREFCDPDWAVMAILAQGGQTTARLKFNVGPGGALELPVEVDFERPFPAADPQMWAAEYEACVSDAQFGAFHPLDSPRERFLDTLPDDLLAIDAWGRLTEFGGFAGEHLVEEFDRIEEVGGFLEIAEQDA